MAPFFSECKKAPQSRTAFLPDESPAGKWLGYDGTKWVPQRALLVEQFAQIVRAGTGAGGVGDGSDDEAKQKAAATKVGSASAAPTAGVGKGSASAAATMCSVRIVGAMGPQIALVNGVYEATSEFAGGMPVYAKVGDPNVYLEYKADDNIWTVQSTDYKGIAKIYAVCDVPAKCLPQNCPVGKWEIVMCDKDIPLPAITIAVVTQQEVAAYRAEVEREAARVVNGSHNVRITGATGDFADSINGE